MNTVEARRLIVAYAALLALFDLAVLLPGNPISSGREFIVAVGIQALVVWRLWHGSSLSWLLGMLFAAGYVVTVALMQPDLEVTVVLTWVLAIAQVMILWTGPIKVLVSAATAASEPVRR